MNIQDLLTSGSAVTILAAIVIAFYTGKVQTKTQSDAALKVISEMWVERFNDERAEKEAWKAQATQLTPAVAKMASELEEANARDELWKNAITAEGFRDRRQKDV